MIRTVLAGTSLMIAAVAGSALADSAPAPEPFARYADPTNAVLAVRADFAAAPGGSVRISVYDSDKSFLERAIVKYRVTIDENGVAVTPLRGLRPGMYAFVAYYDENGDGRLNRGGVLGKPKEPIAFSNGVRPKLRKPHFDEAKVDVEPGAVVVLTLAD